MSVIVVGGMIGAGKTSVAKLLGERLNSQVFFEQVEDNHLLPLFYEADEETEQAKRYPFLLQLTFLSTRFRSIKQALVDQNNVLDRSIYEDWYFCQVNHELGRISELEFKIYEELLNNMMEELEELPKKAPDLMVYLSGSFDTILHRIGLRGRDFEQGDELISYYQKLWEGYDDWVNNHYHASQVVKIDIDRYDVVNNPDHADEVAQIVLEALEDLRA
ncbi:deoxynucleoside kinase [Hutsoniella sourekii]|uniref:deoxynucleoside kinase n=1 Tax=Hutsoniella sourekii TaxID=87650 RepID=UPI000482769A|nr:deoxynucleoside kinase [Hutsoniella sourekii]